MLLFVQANALSLAASKLRFPKTREALNHYVADLWTSLDSQSSESIVRL